MLTIFCWAITHCLFFPTTTKLTIYTTSYTFSLATNTQVSAFMSRSANERILVVLSDVEFYSGFSIVLMLILMNNPLVMLLLLLFPLVLGCKPAPGWLSRTSSSSPGPPCYWQPMIHFGHTCSSLAPAHRFVFSTTIESPYFDLRSVLFTSGCTM